MDRGAIHSEHFTDENGNPAGGNTFGCGFAIGWQHGPLGQGKDRKEPNGAFVENVIQAVIDRLRYYQTTKFECPENRVAIFDLERALNALQLRTAKRDCRGVEGTHEV